MEKTKLPQKNLARSRIAANATNGRKNLSAIKTLHGLPLEITKLLAVERDEVDLEEYFHLTSIMLRLLEKDRTGREGEDV